MPDRRRTLFVSDLDGTLINKDAALQPESVRLINDCLGNGLRFSYATARSWNSAHRIVKDLRLTDPVAVYNGAFIVDPRSGQIIEACTLTRATSDEIVRSIVAAGVYPLVYAMIDGVEKVSWLHGHESAGIRSYLGSRKGDNRLREVSELSALGEGTVFYLSMMGARREMETLLPLVRGFCGLSVNFQEDVYTKDEFWLEIARADATKADGVRRLISHTGADYVICFGDNLNDLPMFAIAHEAYAVSNAHPALHKQATGVIGGNQEDSVARFIDDRFRALK